MNADAGNLPDMLREKVVQYCKSWHFSGADGPDIGPELAALVEAARGLRACPIGEAVYDPEAAAARGKAYDEAEAALAAKIGGKG